VEASTARHRQHGSSDHRQPNGPLDAESRIVQTWMKVKPAMVEGTLFRCVPR
jgi:hypothetical protein